MTDRDTDRFKQLFVAAMADAPHPVGLDEIVTRADRVFGDRALDDDIHDATADVIPIDVRTPTVDTVGSASAASPTRRWAIAVSAGLAAALIVAFVVVPSRGNGSLQTSDSAVTQELPSVETQVPPRSTIPPSPATTDLFATIDDPPVAVLATASGVERRAADGTVSTLAASTKVAHAAADGRVFATLTTGEMVQWNPDDGTVEVLDLPEPTNGRHLLHDVAQVAGSVSLLYEYSAAPCGLDVDDCEIALGVFEPDTGETIGLVTLGRAGSEWVTVDLADSGIVIGEYSDVRGSNFHSGLSSLDVDAQMPDASTLGLPTGPVVCVACPGAYAIDRPGQHIAWVEGQDLVVVDLDEPARRVVARGVVPDLGDDVIIDVVDLVIDDDEVVSGVVSVSTSDGESSVVVDLATSTTSPVLAGRVTLG